MSRIGRTPRISFLWGGFFGGESDGRPGDGGGENTKWLKLKREDVDDRGPFSATLYEAARRRLIRGGKMALACAVLLRSSVGGMLKNRNRNQERKV